MKRKISKKWNVAKTMPPLRHSFAGQDFDIRKSEVAKWLCSQPEIMQLIFNAVNRKEIIYIPDTGKWQGADYVH